MTGQDIAEYAVMLAVILVVVIGTIRFTLSCKSDNLHVRGLVLAVALVPAIFPAQWLVGRVRRTVFQLATA